VTLRKIACSCITERNCVRSNFKCETGSKNLKKTRQLEQQTRDFLSTGIPFKVSTRFWKWTLSLGSLVHTAMTFLTIQIMLSAIRWREEYSSSTSEQKGKPNLKEENRLHQLIVPPRVQ